MPVFIGDTHGKYDQYKRIIKQYKDTIQVGDMGVGFRKFPHGEWQANPPHELMVTQNATFIRGNHDNPHVCKRHSQWIADGRVVGDMMFIGGGLSIDKKYRIEDYSWWPEEELSQEEMWRIAEIYAAAKPRIMVTHEAPTSAAKAIHGSHHFEDNSRTRQFLEVLFRNNNHRPEVWVHGHHHISKDHVIDGTRFVCLAELEVKEIK